MKHSIVFKFLAVLLCAASLAAALCGGAGIAFAAEENLYSRTAEDWLADRTYSYGYDLAYKSAQLYAAKELGNCPPEVLAALRQQWNMEEDSPEWTSAVSQDGKVLTDHRQTLPGATEHTYQIGVLYPSPAPSVPVDSMEATVAEDKDVAAFADTAGADNFAYTEYIVADYGQGVSQTVRLDYYSGPVYEVSLRLCAETLFADTYPLVGMLYSQRFNFIILVLCALLVFAASLVYLCSAAGREPGTDAVVPAAFNRIPLDLYALLAGGGTAGLCALVVVFAEYVHYHQMSDEQMLFMAFGGAAAVGIGLLIVGFVFALAAQTKVGGGYWWRHSIIGFCLCKLMALLRRFGAWLKMAGRGCAALFRLLPIVWQWLLTAAAMVLGVLISAVIAFGSYGFAAMLGALLLFAFIFGDIAVICYGAYCYGTLMKGAKMMAQGDLHYHIPTRYLYGSFRDFANELNSLAGAAQIAAERQMKSERMKTELITNVSHDIKTPLTSIINYVDLLKKPHTDTDGALYLEVLDRQSARLKKLIDDLMEMSKASSGNLTVEIMDLDAVEAVNQALGEFADKLAGVNLVPVFRHPETPVTMRADGRLVWRVMSNLLGNAVKYALPDTRLYIDLMVLQGNAVIAVKNISRDQLNVSAEELMERFVRGDTARNTEGSGLGLNIAKSLVELQHGQMHLMVDGDLFKVTLIFPCA